MILFPAGVAQAQYPPPTPTPTSSPTGGATLDCTIESGPDFLIVECTGTGFGPGTEVLFEVFIDLGGSAASDADTEVLGVELSAVDVVTTDDNGNVEFETLVPHCDIQMLQVVATGESPGGNPVEAVATVDDPAVLACATGVLGSGSGSLSTTGADWLRWLTLGLVLVTAGAWIANVRDEREAIDHRVRLS